MAEKPMTREEKALGVCGQMENVLQSLKALTYEMQDGAYKSTGLGDKPFTTTEKAELLDRYKTLRTKLGVLLQTLP